MRKIFWLLLVIACPATAQLKLTGSVKMLALGDSYTIGESVPESQRWPVQLMDSLRKRSIEVTAPRILATTGWRTDNLATAIKQAKLKPEYNLVTVLIGVNNFYQGKSVESFKPEFEKLLQTAVKLAGGHRDNVVVLSIPDYGYTPFGQSNQAEISAGIDAYNQASQRIAASMDIRYINITDISRRALQEPSLVAKDGLHPSGKMYAAWVKRVLDEIF
jgi:lysophospholipase L1-like esterase